MYIHVLIFFSGLQKNQNKDAISVVKSKEGTTDVPTHKIRGTLMHFIVQNESLILCQICLIILQM